MTKYARTPKWLMQIYHHQQTLQERYWKQRAKWLIEKKLDEDLYSTAWLLRPAPLGNEAVAINLRDGKVADKHIKRCSKCRIGWEYPINVGGGRRNESKVPIYHTIHIGCFKKEQVCPRCAEEENDD